MAEEVVIHLFGHKEIVELLIKRQDIHEGLWCLAVEFGFAAANVGPTPDQIAPSGVVAIVRIGIKQSQTADALTVDAAKANPKT